MIKSFILLLNFKFRVILKNKYIFDRVCLEETIWSKWSPPPSRMNYIRWLGSCCIHLQEWITLEFLVYFLALCCMVPLIASDGQLMIVDSLLCYNYVVEILAMLQLLNFLQFWTNCSIWRWSKISGFPMGRLTY